MWSTMQFWPREYPGTCSGSSSILPELIHLWDFRSFSFIRGTKHGKGWFPLQPFHSGVLERLKAAGVLQNASGPGLAGEIASEIPICQGSGCPGASPASARNTPEVLLRVISRDKGTDIRVSQIRWQGHVHKCLRSKIFTGKLYLLEVRQWLWQSLQTTNSDKLKVLYFFTILIDAVLKIISLISVVVGVWVIRVMVWLYPSLLSLIYTIYSVRL